MIIETKRDFFELTDKNVVAYAINADFNLAGGIAKKMNELYDTQRKLHEVYECGPENVGKALYIEGIFHLVVKNAHNDKVNPDCLLEALENMKAQCHEKNIDYIVMPWVCCGGEKLTKNIVEHILSYVFGDSAIDVIIVSHDEPFIKNAPGAEEFANSLLASEETEEDESDFAIPVSAEEEADEDEDEDVYELEPDDEIRVPNQDQPDEISIEIKTSRSTAPNTPSCAWGPCDTPPEPAQCRKHKYIPRCCRCCPCHGRKC